MQSAIIYKSIVKYNQLHWRSFTVGKNLFSGLLYLKACYSLWPWIWIYQITL